jgi:hypothetical protein
VIDRTAQLGDVLEAICGLGAATFCGCDYGHFGTPFSG